MAESSSLPFDALKPVAGRALETALNRALALDPETRAALAPLSGKRVTLRLASPPLTLQIAVEGERLTVGPVDEATEPDLAVRSTLGALIGQLPFLRRDEGAPAGKLHVSGDADLARRLQRLAERFDPDWQRPFAAVFGDVLGVQIANAAAAAFKQARIAAASLAEDAAEFVTEESRDVVSKAELNAFHDDVDRLRDGVDRAAARVARLQANAGARE
ncbi:SCP2 domain-containing protein [Luteimonas gilva]|uniref:Ubiquinone biosynthesis accessory factor UbiJ n=1 Tax=Luteimonas gilva TaxID=2572684 RepID=A0A4U5JMA6_9GAMM|nr:SCP2 sterol-binding domain-containing protein [Luteimonas gilva]TKR30305.1 SCP2 domain-containing protein [Luteimonas gilva]